MCGQPARVASLRAPSPVTDVRNACEELAASKGYDRSAAGLSRALEDLIGMSAARLPLGLGDELVMAMSEADGDLMPAGDDGYALPDYGDEPKLPCSTVKQVLDSWQKLHTHYRKRLSAEDFAAARGALLDAADRLATVLHHPCQTNVDRAGTPGVEASYLGSAFASEVDRYLAMTGRRVPHRSASNPADLRLDAPWNDDLALAGAYGGQAVMAGQASVMPGMTEADLIATRNARSGLFSRKPARVTGQTAHRDFAAEDDPTDHVNPTRGGDVHPEIARLMLEHNGGPLGQLFGGETPRGPNRRQAPKVTSGNRVNRASGNSTLVAMSQPSSQPGGLSFSRG